MWKIDFGSWLTLTAKTVKMELGHSIGEYDIPYYLYYDAEATPTEIVGVIENRCHLHMPVGDFDLA